MRALIVCLLLASCFQVGPRLGTFAAANNPAGASAMIRAGTRRYAVELLAATDTSYIVEYAGSIAEVKFREVVVVTTSGRMIMSQPGKSQLAEVRLLTRFPYGMPPAARIAILEKAKQDTVFRLTDMK
jgi:hypothetical protein